MADVDDPQPPPALAPAGAGASARSLADLPVAGLTRRRIALLLGAVVAAWVILLFAHQAGQASEAGARVDAMRAANEGKAATVEALQRELSLVAQRAYVTQQARQYRLGSAKEIPFALADNAPPLSKDAPGSVGAKLGAAAERRSPIESWFQLLFGPGGDPADASRAGG